MLVSKRRRSARRIKQPAQLSEVFSILGSNLNPILTQLAKTRKAVFVEGKDFQIIGRFARKLGLPIVANRSEFAVISVEGFNPDRVKSIKSGIETTLGGPIGTAAILDKDYRSEGELAVIERTCAAYIDLVKMHRCKEIENFLLVPTAIDRAAARKVAERNRRSGVDTKYTNCAERLLTQYAAGRKSYVTAQYLAYRRRFERTNSPGVAEETVNEATLAELEECWTAPLQIVPGKEALGALNEQLQAQFGVSVTPTAIIDAMNVEEIPRPLTELLQELAKFAGKERGRSVRA